MRRVVLATGNAGKLREMRAILAGHGLQVLPQSQFGIAPPPETGDSFAANALLKARHAAAASELPAIADDSGLEVDALGGRPGLHSARFAGEPADDRANNERLMAELDGVPEGRRGARYRCAMAFVQSADDPRPIVAEASWPGRIGLEPRGGGGFGYDPYFVTADGRTAAEMPADEKNRVSHRGQALALLAARMREAGW
ncbi:MAG: RdgB/HAM1 family non-canonical purine NTP pyrophosphatase [Steroidobacteraceae bacterium]|nr:RdgB/HAM1 family non-canonical purine NTP pyrophosphatase [Steroidobacteraceae bacterium]